MSIMTDTLALNNTIQVTYSNGTIIPHIFNQSTGYVNFTALVPGGDREELLSNYFNIEYYTANITLTNSSENRLIAGVLNNVHKLNITSHSTRPIQDVYSYFNFDDSNQVSSRFYKGTDSETFTTEITNRDDVLFTDSDGNGGFDKIEWFIENMSTVYYELRNAIGNPVQISHNIEILNSPIKPFDNIDWRDTITVYNPNNFETEASIKIELPLGSGKIKLDNISKNLEYDEFGLLQPYVTIVDKNDPAHKSSVYLHSGQTKTFVLDYTTDSVTITSSYQYPKSYTVGRSAEIVQILRIKNQADSEVEDLEFSIPIDYAENLVACQGEFKNGCDSEQDEAFDEKSKVIGEYNLNIDSFDALEVKEITLTYEIPTVEIKGGIKKTGKVNVNGTLLRFDSFTMKSIAPFKLDNVVYMLKDINYSNIILAKEIKLSGESEELSLEGGRVNLGLFDVGDEKHIEIWSYVTEDIEETFLSKALSSGRQIYLEEGTILYYIFGMFSDKDPNGNNFIYVGKAIFISIFTLILLIILIYLLFNRKKVIRDVTNIIKNESKE